MGRSQALIGSIGDAVATPNYRSRYNASSYIGRLHRPVSRSINKTTDAVTLVWHARDKMRLSSYLLAHGTPGGAGRTRTSVSELRKVNLICVGADLQYYPAALNEVRASI